MIKNKIRGIRNKNMVKLGLILLMTIIVIISFSAALYFIKATSTFVSLLTWEVDNPVSKVFVMDNIPPTSGSLAAGNASVPNEYLPDPAIDSLVLLMDMKGVHLYKTLVQPSGIVGSNDIVIIKASFQWDFRNTTSTDRIKGLIWRVLQHPDGFTGEILVGDNTQWAPIGEDDNNSEDTQQCILDVINTFHSKGYPVHLFRWTDIMYNVVTEYSDGNYNDGYTYEPISKITYPKFQSPAGNYISLKYGIWNGTSYNHDRLCLINFPVLKAHGQTGATLGIKNWMGVITRADENGRYGNTDGMHNYMLGPYALVAKVMQVTFPKLTIIDGAWANPERNYGNIAVQLNMLLGSTDPFAASWYAAKYMLTPVAYYPEITNPDYPITYYNSYKTFLHNQYNCMIDSGFAVTINPTEMSVYLLSENPLPVELSSFTATVINGRVHLNWTTKTEVNNYGFDIERNSGEGWYKISFVEGNGNSNSPKYYTFIDYYPAGGNKLKYRLKQIDTDGIFEYSDAIEVNLILTSYKLYQNYPNPFKCETTVDYEILESSDVTIKVYNISGEEITTLVNERKDVGRHWVKFDAVYMPSGVYFCKLQIVNYIEIKKMIIIK